jgi:hypothetical protein
MDYCTTRPHHTLPKCYAQVIDRVWAPDKLLRKTNSFHTLPKYYAQVIVRVYAHGKVLPKTNSLFLQFTDKWKWNCRNAIFFCHGC